MTVDWRKVAGQMRADLDRAALNERPRMVLAVLIKATLMRGRTTVVLPDREVLCDLLGIAKQHMAGVWREIEGAHIATFRKVALGWEVVLLPDAGQWACEWVYTRDQVNQWIDFIERVPGQSQGSLLPADPNLRVARAECAAEAVSNQKRYPQPRSVTESVTRQTQPVRSPVPVNSTAVLSASYKAVQTVVPVKAVARQANAVGQSAEAALYERLKAFLASSPHESDRKDLAAWGGHWRVHHLRPDLEKFDTALRMLEGDVSEGREAKRSRAAWLKDLLKR